MNPALKAALDNLKPAVDAAIEGAEAQLPALTTEAENVLEQVLIPKLDIPSFLLPFVKGLVTKIDAPLDAIGKSELDLLKARLDAIL